MDSVFGSHRLYVRLTIISCSWHRASRRNRLSSVLADAYIPDISRWTTTSHGSGRHSGLTMLSVAALAEILAYYVPGVDNLLDSLATPAALVAGTVVSAAVMTDLPPMVKWTAAVIAGGGVAGLTQGVTAMLRAKSTILTGGLGNSVIATAELGGALLFSLLTLAAPLAALALVILFLWLAIRLLRQLFRAARPSSSQNRR